MRKLLLSSFLLFSALYVFAGEGIEIEQINITAQKYEEKQNKAPLNVDAFDDSEIASRDITELKCNPPAK